MKALVRKYPINVKKKDLNEVYIEPTWHDWIDRATGAPLTDENLAYALCEEVPDDFQGYLTEDKDPTDLFEVTEHTKEAPSDLPEETPQTVRYWTARFIGVKP